MNEYTEAPAYIIDFLSEAEGAPRLKAKLCMGGAWEVGWGQTFDEAGKPFRMGDTITYERAVELRKYALGMFADGVRKLLTVQVAEHQFWAMVVLAYNIGLDAFSQSTVLRETNAGNFANAAHAFERWTGASKDGPDGANPNDSALDFVAPDGSPAGYFRRLRGLLRRHLGEACIYEGYDWKQATRGDHDNDPIAMTVCAREKRYWNQNKWRWEDQVLSYTPYKQVQQVAKAYPLPLIQAEPRPSSPAASAGQPVVIAPSPPQAALPPPTTKPAAVPSGPAAAGPAPVPAPPLKPAPVPSPAPLPKPPASPPVIAGQDGTKPKSPWTVQPEDVHYKLDPNAGLKPLEDSDRAKAFVWQRVFLLVIYAGGAGVFGKTAQAGSELLMKHAALMSVVLDLAVPLAMSLAVMLVGCVGKSWADWCRHRAQRRSSQGLY